MTDKDWLLLQVLSKEKNITKAAARLFMSQPALSGHIQQLEKEFGCPLIIRGARGIAFTNEGEILVNYATRSLDELCLLKEHVTNLTSEVRGTLRIGCVRSFASHMLPNILEAFRNQSPKVDVFLRTGFSQDIYRMLLEDKVHLGILRGEYPWPGQMHLLRIEPYFLVSAEPINIKKLPLFPRINYVGDGPLLSLLGHWWLDHYTAPPYITMEVDAVDTCLQMVSKGLGYALLSGIWVENTPRLYKTQLFLKDESPLQRKMWLYHKTKLQDILTVKVFIDFLRTKVGKAEISNNISQGIITL